MKPHLTYRAFVWSCSTWALNGTIGYGYTPQEAYRDWMKLRS